jgi:nitrogen-specific signal transduction histidine kinase/DNA-binding NarL/FixJ family response regulator
VVVTFRVLHVDADPASADAVALHLERKDDRLEVVTESSVGDGLDRLADGGFDCVVSDHAPGVDGLAFLEAVREEHSDLPFVLFTGDGSEAVAGDAVSKGATDYLRKGGGTEQYELLASRVLNAAEAYRADPVERREAAETRYRSLFENNPIVIWEEDFSAAERYVDSLLDEVDDLGAYLDENPDELDRIVEYIEVIDVNENALDYYGADSKRELVERLDRLMTEQSREANRAMWEHIADGATQFRAETVSRTLDGERRDEIIELNVPEAYADDYSRVYLTVTDITERKDRERTLERLHRATRGLVTAETPDEVAREVAEAARDLLGYAFPVVRFQEGNRLEPAYAVSELHDVADTIPAYDIGESLAGRAFAAGDVQIYEDVRDVDDSYNRGVTRSAMYVPIGEYGVISVADTEPAAFSGTDVTFIELLASSARTALDVIEQRRTLQRQNERLDEFASIVSHDLRNPLNVADGHLELARGECDSDHLDDAARALDRMDALIGDLLALAREGDRVRDPEAVDLAAAVSRCWATVETADATLAVDADSTIQADRSRLLQLLENLFGNAVEHGGGSVTITVGDIDDAGFYVADDGPGVPEGDREQVFDSGYSTTEGGTGLGLSIVREIAEGHGWTVAVTDSDDGGARFEISGVEVVS